FSRSITKIWSYSSKWRSMNCCARCSRMSTPYRSATAMDRRSGGLPTCQLPVPAELTVHFKPLLLAKCCNTPCASGDRQILPKHSMIIFIIKLLNLQSKYAPLALFAVYVQVSSVQQHDLFA